MKLTEATWEDKVLGVRCFDVEIDSTDVIEDFLKLDSDLVHNRNAGYITVRTPANLSSFLFGLSKCGYTFVEASIGLTLVKNNYVSPNFINRFMKDTTVRQLTNPEDYQRVYEEVSKGAFNTDRFYINPNITNQQASQRYINWMRGLLESGEKIFEVLIKNDPVGFFIFKHIDDKTVQGVLTGVYKKYSGTPYGTVVMKYLQDTVWGLGYGKFLGRVVSNNVPALRLNMAFGNVIEDISYHYVKHI